MTDSGVRLDDTNTVSITKMLTLGLAAVASLGGLIYVKRRYPWLIGSLLSRTNGEAIGIQ